MVFLDQSFTACMPLLTATAHLDQAENMSSPQALVEATSLAFPLPQEPCILDMDASDVAVGAVLSQKVDGVQRPIAFFSRVMNSTQRNYCTTRRELLAVISTLQHFCHYLLGNKVVLRTDQHSLYKNTSNIIFFYKSAALPVIQQTVTKPSKRKH